MYRSIPHIRVRLVHVHVCNLSWRLAKVQSLAKSNYKLNSRTKFLQISLKCYSRMCMFHYALQVLLNYIIMHVVCIKTRFAPRCEKVVRTV